ncbi:MAG: hypothetical protein HYZ84_06510 [Candidatus Omnitrophica bacterium]|nr:hypothetical protein [Candidatus Omnitrophota bacterium]
MSGSFFQALKNKKLFYAGLFATWKIAFSGLPFASSESVGFTIGFSPWEYLRTQPGVLLHYLKISFWPYPLCFDYVWPVARNFESIIFPSLVVIPMGLAVLWGFWKKTPAAFCGLWFFLILAPTSSIIPLLDLAAEHRMYLPLAGVISFAVMAAYRIVAAVTAPLTRTKQWVFFSVLFILAGILSFATWQRNRDYRSGEIMWKDVIQKRPGNYRASYNLANYYSNHGNNSEAVKYYVHAISLEPRYSDAQIIPRPSNTMSMRSASNPATPTPTTILAGSCTAMGSWNWRGIVTVQRWLPIPIISGH